jgi:hypothetical protein
MSDISTKPRIVNPCSDNSPSAKRTDKKGDVNADTSRIKPKGRCSTVFNYITIQVVKAGHIQCGCVADIVGIKENRELGS